MRTDGTAYPPTDAWVAAVHDSEADFEPLGTAVVIDVNRVLTCAHVVISEGAVREPLWVAFPKGGDCPRRRVAMVTLASSPPVPVRDLAVLVLEEPVPPGVERAPLRYPKGEDLVSQAWWAFGFPDRDPVGDSADGHVGASLSYGWVRLDTGSRYLIRPGFSGGGLWSQDYQAVVGIVGQAHANGDGRAITLHQADLCFPDHELAALASWSVATAGEVALTQWGWALERDPEGVRHWRPRARGVTIESERGWRFRGRAAALRRIVSWLDRATLDRRVLVITGSPGVGKSAVLGRIVTTADVGVRGSLPPGDAAVRASVGSVGCAVHAKGKTALEVAEEIARAASATLPGEPDDLAPAIRDALSERGGRRFNVIIDALDEASSPAQARAIMDRVVLPLAETCSDVGAQIIVGTRRRDDGGDLLGRFGAALSTLDLDDPGYFAEVDLTAYALACLQLADDERPGNPYTDDKVAVPLAARIAEMSEQNFLVGGLIARSHGLHDEKAVSPDQLGFAATVDSALAAYLERLSPVAGLPAAHVLTALAFAQAPGLPAGLWQVAVDALYCTPLNTDDLTQFARSSAANFLIETGDQATENLRSSGSGPVYRLFHQALNDALLRARAAVKSLAYDEAALTRALITRGQLSKWQEAPDYLLRSLPGHAQAAGLVDDLLTDDTYLLYADLRRLMQVSDDAVSAQGRRRARLLRLTPTAVTAAHAERAALFSVTEALDGLGVTYRADRWKAPYRAQWAAVRPRSERAVLEGHQDRVRAVCTVTVAGQELLASAGSDGTVRIWDPQTGEERTALQGHRGMVNGVCAITLAGQELLASAGQDGTIRIWDPQTSQQRAVMRGHQDWVTWVCAITVARQELLASAGFDRVVRIWNPQTGEERIALRGHRGMVNGVCAITLAGQELLASADSDRTVRIWDLQARKQRAILRGHQSGIRAVCAVAVAGEELLASASDDRTVRIWDLQAREQRAVLRGHQAGVSGVCVITVAGQELLASTGADGTVRIWDLQAREQRAVLRGNESGFSGVCSVTVAGQELLASAGDDGTVRIWDPRTGEQRTALQRHQDWVRGLCSVTVNGQELLASAGDDHTVRIWNPQTGEQRTALHGHQGGVSGVCAVTVAGQELLASASDDHTVRIWDPQTGEERTALRSPQYGVSRVIALTVAGQELLASASDNGNMRIWDPQGREQQAVLEGHQDWVRGLCSVTVNGQELLASASDDRTVRIWDPQTGEERAVMQGHQAGVNGVCSVTVNGQELLASASNDETVRLWNPKTHEERAVLRGHQDWVNGVCTITVNGHELLASASTDRTVRIWDPQTGACVLAVPTHHAALAIARIGDALAIGLEMGILVIRLHTASLKP